MFRSDRSAKGDVVIFSLSGRITAKGVLDLRGLVAAEGKLNADEGSGICQRCV